MEYGKSTVALAKEDSIQESVTKVFDLLGGITGLIDEGDSVVLKPNAGHAAPPPSLRSAPTPRWCAPSSAR